MFRGTDRMSKRSWGSFGWWALIVIVIWTIAWIIAEAIPVFNDLLGLISALFASWFTYGLSGVFWLYMNYGQYKKNATKMFLTLLNFLIFCIGAAIVSWRILSNLDVYRIQMLTLQSVDLVSTLQAQQSTPTPRPVTAVVLPAPTIRMNLLKQHVVGLPQKLIPRCAVYFYKARVPLFLG